jgi:exopolysaccharide production protein ExoQ
MTATVAAFPRPRAARPSLVDAAVFAGAVFMLLIYSQGWEIPLTGGGDESADSALLRTMFLPAYAVGVGILALAPWNTVKGLARQPFLVVIMCIVTASVFWSVSPDQTTRRIFAIACTTLSGVVLAARYSWARLAEVIAACFAVLAVISLITGLFIPSIGRMVDLFPGAWRGLWPEKNAFGGNMAFGVVLCASAAVLTPIRARYWWGAAGLCFFLVLMSTSKTALVSVLLGVGAFSLVWAVRRGPAMSIAATWGAVVGLGVVVGMVLFASDVLFGLLGKDATLTGRTQIWAGVMRRINLRPWEGYGYGATWDETDNWGPLAWITHDAGFRAHHAHNSWLEQWLGLGVPGLVAWAGFFLQTLVANIVALYREKGAYLALPFFVIYSLTTLTESIAVVYNDMRWVIFVALAVKLALPDPRPSRPSVRDARPPARGPRR